ncbi:MAG: MMPL family transporter, partial [Pseudomonadales bacterium]|nr:MMPL family transporter [Pseudomonadales bacterium]
MHWMLHKPRLAVALFALFLLVPGPLLLKVRLDNAPEIYFPADDPAVVFDQALREQFPQDQVLVALFQGDDLYETAFLQKLDTLVQRLEMDPEVNRVLAVTTMDQIRATPEGFAVEPLINPMNLDETTSAQRRERATQDRFAPGMIVAPEGDFLAVVLRPSPMESSLQRLELEQLLRRQIDASGLSPWLSAVAGHVALDVAQLRAMMVDLATLIPGSLAIGLPLLWWLFRRWLVVALAATTIAAVTGMSVGLLVLLGKPFTLISAIIPPLLTALTVAMLMHLFNAILHAAQRGLEGEERMRAAITSVALPIAFTALTTAAGLASLMVSPIRPIETFGMIAAIGVLFAAAIVILLVPALVMRFDRAGWVVQRRGMRWVDSFTDRMARLALRRVPWVLGGATLLLAIAIPQITRVEVETDLYAFFSESHPITTATRRVEENLSGVMTFEVVFDGPEFNSLLQPQRLQAIRAVQQWLDERPEVDYSLSLPDLIAEMHWAFNEEDPGFRAIPDNEPLIAQYLFIYDGRDLFDLVNRDFNRTRLVLNLNITGARELNAFMAELRARLEAQPPADLQWEFAGMGRLFADQERLLIQGQLDSLLVVVSLVLVMMGIMWRSLPVTLVSMVPNLAPVVFIFALMGLLGIWLDMATAMIASVAVGIALDDTIHILHGYLEHRRTGYSE